MADTPKPGADPSGELTPFEQAIQNAFDGKPQEPDPNTDESIVPEGQTIEEITSEFEGDETTDIDEEVSEEEAPVAETEPDGEEVEGEESAIPTADSTPSTFTWRGVEYDQTGVDTAFETANWLSQQGPEFINAINALASGQYILTRRDQQPAPDTPPSSPTPVAEEDIIDPAAHARLSELEAEYARIRQMEQDRTQVEAQNTLNQRLALVVNGQDRWAESHSTLTPTEVTELRDTVANLAILPGLIQSNGGDIAKAMETAMEQVYWSTPKYRELELNKQMERERTEAQETTTRRRKASSLAGSGGSTSRTPPAANTKQSRLEAMSAELAAHMNNGGQAT